METEIGVLELVKNHPLGTEESIPELLEYDMEGTLIGRGYFITSNSIS
jgi:hypothetical protein